MKKLIIFVFILFVASSSFGQNWLLAGNAGTTTTSFIGTTDAKILRLRTKFVDRIIIDTLGLVTIYNDAVINGLTIGKGAGSSVSNSSLGYQCMYRNTTGVQNTAVGYQTLAFNTSGNFNSGIGGYTLWKNTTGSYNTANGTGALSSNISGLGNTADGSNALLNNLYGKANTSIGDSSMITNTIGNNNTAIGYYANVSVNNLNNATAIGNSAIVDASNKVRIGNSAITSIGGQVAWTSFSDGRIKKNIKSNVPGLEFINLLKPVTYNYDLKKQFALEGSNANSENYDGKDDIEKISFSGFIAQEVDEAAKRIGYVFSGVDKSGNIMGLRYSDFVVPVVKSVQELSNQNEELKKEIDDLKNENQALTERLDKLEKMLSGNSINNTSVIANKLATTAFLEQNVPNPSNSSTTVWYNLPQYSNNAYINFYNLNGVLNKSVRINKEGKNSITINRNEFSKGVYNYVLIIDGKYTDAKQMIIE